MNESEREVRTLAIIAAILIAGKYAHGEDLYDDNAIAEASSLMSAAREREATYRIARHRAHAEREHVASEPSTQ